MSETTTCKKCPARVLTGEDLRVAHEDTHEPLYMLYFVTCPEAESFKRMGIGRRKR